MKANIKAKKEKTKKDRDGAMINVAGAITAIILLIVGFAIAALLTVFTAVLGGQTYQLTEDDITSISNTTIRGYVENAIGGAFEAQSQVSDYLPIIALAVIITIVITLIIGGIASQFLGGGGGMGGGGYYGGGGRYDSVL